MKILIIGEFSGVSYNLKIGLTKLGHKVINFTEGDGWKKIPIHNEDYLFNNYNFKVFNFYVKGSWRLLAFINYCKFQKIIRQYKRYFDLIIIISYEFIRPSFSAFLPRFTVKDIDFISKKNAPIFMMACGVDLPYLIIGKSFRYWPYDNVDLADNVFLSPKYIKLFYEIYYKITAIIPCLYDFAECYRSFEQIDKSKIAKTIPFAFATDNTQYRNEISDGVIRIFHGLNRDHFKGSDIITQALSIIKNKYDSKVEIVIDGRMPLNKYLEIIKNSNIIIDQCKSYSYGMNALYCMSLGKLVMSGNELECQKEYERFDIPIVNILPSVNDIVEKLDYFICHPQEILDYGLRSRKFVEEFHNPERIAQIYLDLMRK